MSARRKNSLSETTEWLLMSVIALFMAWAIMDDGFGSGWEMREKRAPQAAPAPNAPGCGKQDVPGVNDVLKAEIERGWRLKAWA